MLSLVERLFLCTFVAIAVDVEVSRPDPFPGDTDGVVAPIPGRSQDDEKLTFLSNTLGSNMVLQRAPAQAMVWGFTAPGAKVTTTMSPSNDASGQLQQTFVATAAADGTWRQKLPATSASKTPYSFTFSSSNSTAEKATILGYWVTGRSSAFWSSVLQRVIPDTCRSW
jgi:hypothetical protein